MNRIILTTQNAVVALMNRIQCLRDTNALYDTQIDELITLRAGCCGESSSSSLSSSSSSSNCCPTELWYSGNRAEAYETPDIGIIHLVLTPDIFSEYSINGYCRYTGTYNGNTFYYTNAGSDPGGQQWSLTRNGLATLINQSDPMPGQHGCDPCGDDGLGLYLRTYEVFDIISYGTMYCENPI